MNTISLFSGAMGLDLGLEQAGFKIRVACEQKPSAVEAIRANRPEIAVVEADVRDVTADQLTTVAGLRGVDVDLVCGGPPCQSYSTAGGRKGGEGSRGPLVFEFLRIVGEVRPRAFLMENVKGILSASLKWRELPYNNNGKPIDELHGSVLAELRRRVGELGYSFGFAELLAADFGVPQMRRRVFFMGFREGHEASFPQPTHAQKPGLFTVPHLTLGQALDGLNEEEPVHATFSPRKLKYLRMVKAGENWRSLPEDIQRESMGRAFFAKGGRTGYWRRLSFDRPCPTILTEPQNASTSLCHPVHDRPLSVRECARVQTFPDDWVFAGSRSAQYRLVGNAVPPLLAQQVGLKCRAILSEAGSQSPHRDSGRGATGSW